MLLYGREVEVAIFKKNDTSFGRESYKNYDISNNNQYRISFDIRFDSSKNKNDATIKIYNLADFNRYFFTNEKDLTIELYAGYNGTRSLIYKGDVLYVSVERNGSDYITMFKCGDGAQAIKNLKISLSFEPQTTFKSMFQALGTELKNLGISIKKDFANVVTGKTAFGEVLDGKVNNIFDKLTKKQGLKYNIVNNNLEIIIEGEPINKDAVVLTPSTGLIGVPIIKKDLIQFDCLIQPSNIFPSRLVQLESSTVNGFYIIQSCQYTGDTHSNDWKITSEAKKYGKF
jgi:hypothetical protein